MCVCILRATRELIYINKMLSIVIIILAVLAVYRDQIWSVNLKNEEIFTPRQKKILFVCTHRRIWTKKDRWKVIETDGIDEEKYTLKVEIKGITNPYDDDEGQWTFWLYNPWKKTSYPILLWWSHLTFKRMPLGTSRNNKNFSIKILS